MYQEEPSSSYLGLEDGFKGNSFPPVNWGKTILQTKFYQRLTHSGGKLENKMVREQRMDGY